LLLYVTRTTKDVLDKTIPVSLFIEMAHSSFIAHVSQKTDETEATQPTKKKAKVSGSKP